MATKIIVIDDDPTGSQTVHSCLLLLRWDVETLRQGLRHPAPIFFILANTRSMVEAEAIATVREICRHLKTALTLENIEHYLLVSRSDSTLRGHFPAETEAIASELGAFDACFFAPAFFEGGRITEAGVHYVLENQQKIPVSQTEFARDPVFNFHHSFLPDFIAAKTNHTVSPEQIKCLKKSDSTTPLFHYFNALSNGQYIVLDGTEQADFDRLMPDLWQAVNHGKKFLFRSAASLLTSLAQMGQQPTPPAQMFTYRRSPQPGVIIIGSHTQKTTEQLQDLRQIPQIQGIEIDVHQCQNIATRKQLLDDINQQIQVIYQTGKDILLFTNRQVITHGDQQINLEFGSNITTFLSTLVQTLPSDIGFLISKGGNTTNALLRQGLHLQSIQLLGQILAGCCLVRTAAEHQFPQLPIVLFPGNVGDRHSLSTIYERLKYPQ